LNVADNFSSNVSMFIVLWIDMKEMAGIKQKQCNIH